MATKFYNVEKAAEILGIPVAEVNQLRESHQLRGLRDGADWKFKAEEVDALAIKRKGIDSGIGSGIGSDLGMSLLADDDDADVLLSEVELGSSDPSASGTVIGPPPEGDEFDLDPIDSAVTSFEDLDLSIEESGLELASSGIGLSSDIGLDTLGDSKSKPGGHEPTGASSILGLADDDLDDDDLVLGGESGLGGSGSGSGSDITLGGDSGISLIDPADSGISLEEPLDLSSGSNSADEDNGSLGLAGDSLLSFAKDSSIESSSDLTSDGDDFMLSSLEDEEDDDSSQVIALEEEGAGSGIGDSLLDLGSSSPDMLGSQVGLDMGDDDEVVDLSAGLESGSGIGSLGGSGAIDFGTASEGSGTFGSLDSLGDAPSPKKAPIQDFGAAAAVAAGPAVIATSEIKYTKLDYFFLYSSFFTLGLVGLLMYDLVRNMWLWSDTTGVNSWLLEMLFG